MRDEVTTARLVLDERLCESPIVQTFAHHTVAVVCSAAGIYLQRVTSLTGTPPLRATLLLGPESGPCGAPRSLCDGIESLGDRGREGIVRKDPSPEKHIGGAIRAP